MQPEKDPAYVWTSVSQDDKYLGCPRQWAGRYIFKLPEPATRAKSFGTEVHEEIENFYKDGSPPKRHERLVRAMLKLLPSRGPQAVAEGRFEMDVLPAMGGLMGVKLVGFKDLVLELPQDVVVYDHKTTSSPGFAKTQEDLEGGDVQATVYSIDASRRFPHVPPENVWCQWTYGLSKGKKAPWKVEARVPLDVRERVWEELQERSDEMRQWHAEPRDSLTFGDFPANYDSETCRKYGGCPYAEKCNASRQEITVSKRAEFLRKAKAAREAAGGLGSVAEVAPPPPADPINPPEAAEVAELAEPEEEAVEAAVEKVEPAKPVKRRGRPPGAKNKKNNKVDDVEPPKTGGTLPANPADPAPLHVYVNCYPTKGAPEPVMPLADIVGAAARAVEEKAEVPHWSLAEYGSGPGGLAAEFKTTMPRSGTVLVDHFSAEGKALLTVLEAAATLVVKS